VKFRFYDFVAVDGRRIRRGFWDSELPTSYVEGDTEYLLDLGAKPQGEAPNGIVKEHRHVAYQLPRLWQKPELAKIWDKFSPQGHILCEGKRDVQELEARLAHQDGYMSGYRYGKDE
jgi:hypothetical protein